ncbi:MAG TPA: ATP-binding protein, partial [Saprospiraceae bacterium]|nr:ATP-binding protein [Saprospiraceae bacterium]
LQSIRNRIADDLHDDIGSTLNSISVYSEVAKQKSPAVVQELEQIGEASRKIIDAMSDIVWTINTKNDSFEQIILRLRSLTYNLLRAKNIEHTFRADESLNDMKLSMEHRRNFYLIFKEALNNLVKYSIASRVSISLTHENNFITLIIRDNGIGFDVKQTSIGNGLLSMKSRAEEMKAELEIESELGSGTNVELKLRA